jgi:hypothetical protein
VEEIYQIVAPLALRDSCGARKDIFRSRTQPRAAVPHDFGEIGSVIGRENKVG